jgi:hypothetical protein
LALVCPVIRSEVKTAVCTQVCVVGRYLPFTVSCGKTLPGCLAGWLQPHFCDLKISVRPTAQMQSRQAIPVWISAGNEN